MTSYSSGAIQRPCPPSALGAAADGSTPQLLHGPGGLKREQSALDLTDGDRSYAFSHPPKRPRLAPPNRGLSFVREQPAPGALATQQLEQSGSRSPTGRLGGQENAAGLVDMRMFDGGSAANPAPSLQQGRDEQKPAAVPSLPARPWKHGPSTINLKVPSAVRAPSLQSVSTTPYELEIPEHAPCFAQSSKVPSFIWLDAHPKDLTDICC